MELNGVANIKMFLQSGAGGDMPTSTLNTIMEQLEFLERYMLAYADHKASIKSGSYGAQIIGVEEPLWHEILANPKDYPTASERMVAMKKQMGR